MYSFGVFLGGWLEKTVLRGRDLERLDFKALTYLNSTVIASREPAESSNPALANEGSVPHDVERSNVREQPFV